VEADPKPYIEWSKDKLQIHDGWERFEKLKTALKINAIELEDAGNYICVAANGFGSKTINYTLIVLGRWIHIYACRFPPVVRRPLFMHAVSRR
jgi:hypothetical protein